MREHVNVEQGAKSLVKRNPGSRGPLSVSRRNVRMFTERPNSGFVKRVFETPNVHKMFTKRSLTLLLLLDSIALKLGLEPCWIRDHFVAFPGAPG